MASEQDIIIKQSYLHKWRNEVSSKKSAWQSLFFVLHGSSPKNAARLDWYDTQEQFLQSPGLRKALFMEEIKDCKQIPYSQETKELYGSNAKHLLMIQTYRPSVPNYILKCSSQGLLTEWYDCLTKLLQNVLTMTKIRRTTVSEKSLDKSNIYTPAVLGSSSYEVIVDDTAAAVQCELHGPYRLILSQQHITLADQDSGSPVITWMYKYIRRFGYCDRSLTIEGGSRCGIGQGLFIFKTEEGTELMKAINDRMQLCKNLQEDEYSYIPFNKPKESKQEPAESKKTEEPKPKPIPAGQIPQYGVVAVKDKTSTKSTKSISDSQEKPEKPSISKKPSSNSPNQNGRVDSPNSLVQSSQPQPKMSEVLSQLTQQNTPQGQEDGIYGYSHLDIKGTAPKANFMADQENPYGEQLVQKLKISK